MDSLSLFVSNVLKFFFLFTPFFALAMFLSMTEGKTDAERRALAHRIAVATVVIAAALLYCGPFIFRIFGITVDAFRIGGGVLLMLTAISFTHPKHLAGPTDDNFTVVPLAMPVIVGPAAGSAIMVSATELSGFFEKALGFAALITALTLIWGILLLATWFEHILGKRGLAIMMRLSGLILAALSAQMVMTGVVNFMK